MRQTTSMCKLFPSLTAFVMACSGHDLTGPNERSPVALSAVASVTIVPVTASLRVGSTLQLKVILRDASGYVLSNRKVAFTSSDERVLSVDDTGLVRGMAEGEAAIIATSEGKSDRATIAVTPPGDACEGCWDYSKTRWNTPHSGW